MAVLEDALPLFRKGAILFISGLAVTMTVGGLVYYYGFAESLFGDFASLFITGVGSYVLKDALLPGMTAAIETVKLVLRFVVAFVKQLLRALLF